MVVLDFWLILERDNEGGMEERKVVALAKCQRWLGVVWYLFEYGGQLYHHGNVKVQIVPPTGLEPVPQPPEGRALSTELRGRIQSIVAEFRIQDKGHARYNHQEVNYIC